MGNIREEIINWFHNKKWFAIISICITVLAFIIALLANIKTICPTCFAKDKKVYNIKDFGKLDSTKFKSASTQLIPKPNSSNNNRLKNYTLITGIVTDDSTNEAINDVLVSTNDEYGNTIKSKTDETGRFKMNIPYSSESRQIILTLSCRKDGYQPANSAETFSFIDSHPTIITLKKRK